MPDDDHIHVEPEQLLRELYSDARALDMSGQRLGERLKQFEGTVRRNPKDPESDIVELGLKLQWETAVDEALLELEKDMLHEARDPDNKLPATLKARASKMLEAQARVNAKKDNWELWIRYSEMETEIKALEKWVRAKERSSNLRQSILSTMRQTGEIT